MFLFTLCALISAGNRFELGPGLFLLDFKDLTDFFIDYAVTVSDLQSHLEQVY